MVPGPLYRLAGRLALLLLRLCTPYGTSVWRWQVSALAGRGKLLELYLVVYKHVCTIHTYIRIYSRASTYVEAKATQEPQSGSQHPQLLGLTFSILLFLTAVSRRLDGQALSWEYEILPC